MTPLTDDKARDIWGKGLQGMNVSDNFAAFNRFEFVQGIHNFNRITAEYVLGFFNSSFNGNSELARNMNLTRFRNYNPEFAWEYGIDTCILMLVLGLFNYCPLGDKNKIFCILCVIFL